MILTLVPVLYCHACSVSVDFVIKFSSIGWVVLLACFVVTSLLIYTMWNFYQKDVIYFVGGRIERSQNAHHQWATYFESYFTDPHSHIYEYGYGKFHAYQLN